MTKHTLDVKMAGKEGIFICDNDTPIQVVKEMLFHMLKQVGNIEDQWIEKQALEAKAQTSEEIKNEQ